MKLCINIKLPHIIMFYCESAIANILVDIANAAECHVLMYDAPDNKNKRVDGKNIFHSSFIYTAYSKSML